MTLDQGLMLAAAIFEVVAFLPHTKQPDSAYRFEWLGMAFFFATFITN